METNVFLFAAAFISSCCIAYTACKVAFRIEDRVKELEGQIKRMSDLLDRIERDTSYLAIREENKYNRVKDSHNAN